MGNKTWVQMLQRVQEMSQNFAVAGGGKWSPRQHYVYVFVKQDDANRSGGKWIIRLKKGLASRCWENLILAMLGEQFMVGEEICGAVISVRNQVV